MGSNATVATLFGQLNDSRQHKLRQQQLDDQMLQFQQAQLLEKDRLAQQNKQFLDTLQFNKEGQTLGAEQFNRTAGFQENSALANLFNSGIGQPANIAPTDNNLMPGGIGITSPMAAGNIVNIGGRPVTINDAFKTSLERAPIKAAIDAQIAEKARLGEFNFMKSAGADPMTAAFAALNPSAGSHFATSKMNPQAIVAKMLETNDPAKITEAMSMLHKMTNAGISDSQTTLNAAHAHHFNVMDNEVAKGNQEKALIVRGGRFLAEAVTAINNRGIASNDPRFKDQLYNYVNNAPWGAEDKNAAIVALRAETNLNTPAMNPFMQMMGGSIGNTPMALPSPVATQPQVSPEALQYIKLLEDQIKAAQTQKTTNTQPRFDNKAVDAIFRNADRK